MAYRVRIFILLVIVVLAWLGLAHSCRADEAMVSRDYRYGESRCVRVNPISVIAWGYLLENGEIVPFDEARPSRDGTFKRCTRRLVVPFPKT